jgi:rare lipoprotein A (peptidoglycan hydrolase)
MKRCLIVGLLFGIFIIPLTAQQREEGVAIRYNAEGDDDLYAAHKTHPFGTKLIVINPVNGSRATVQVGGRPNPSLNAVIEISQATADKLGIYQDIPTWVWLEVERPAATAAKHVSRPRVGVFRQAGNVTVQASGNDLTASHSSLPMGIKVRVSNPTNKRDITVTINNRIRPSRERILDLSQAAAQALGIRVPTKVEIESTN